MRAITFAGLVLMFFSYAFAPLWLATLIIGCTFALLLSMCAVIACRAAYETDEDCDECLDDVPRYVESEDHKLKPVDKIDIHC